MLRRLLNIASIACLVACVALMFMAMRSNYYCDEVQGSLTSRRSFVITSWRSRLVLSSPSLPKLKGTTARTDYTTPWSISSHHYDSQWQPFYLHDNRSIVPSLASVGIWSMLFLPHWFLVLVSGSLAMAFQLRWPPRFNLRRMFVVTTFLALVLGMIAWLDRSWIGK
jgi:hypothetical protein